jgi:predicted secreted protein
MKYLPHCILLCFSLGCTGPTETPQTDRLTVQGGKTFTLYLKSNASAGYQWYLVNKPLKVDSLEQKYEAKGYFVCNGSGGIEAWKFKGREKGLDTLHFVYSREEPTTSERAFERKYVVEVE